MNFKKGDRVKRNPEWYKRNWGVNQLDMEEIWVVSWFDGKDTHLVNAGCLRTEKLMLVEAAKPKDPLTIRKITCKATGLPLKRVQEIKKALRAVYKTLNEKERGGMDKGNYLVSAFIWHKQPEGEDYWRTIHGETAGAFQ